MANEYVSGKLSDEVVKYCDQAIDKIKEIRMASDRPIVPAEMFEMSQYLLSFRAWLTQHLLESEARYRDKIEEYREKDMSVAAADTIGKTTNEYRAWQYLRRIDDLADEQVKLVKKFSGRMEEEFKMS